MRNLTWLLISGAILAASATLTRAETLEEVQKKITEKGLSYKSLAYKQSLVTDAKMGDEGKAHFESEGTVELLRKGDEYLVRTDQKTKTESEFSGQKMNDSGKVLSIYDGEYLYTLLENQHGKQATRQKTDKNLNNVITKDMFKQIQEMWDLKLLPDDKVNGRAAWVIELRPKKETKDGQPNQMLEMYSRMVTWYDQETAVALKSIGYDKGGKEAMKLTTSDIKVNADIPAERFKFQAPEGVTVMDMDAIHQQMNEDTNSAAASEEHEKEAPAKSTREEKPAEEKKTTKEDSKPEKKKEEKKGVKGLFDRLK